MRVRVGFGFDVHRLEEGVDFFLGGVHLESEKGAVGHSDADVLIHAICDALLGAANLGDIGLHFPNTDPKYKGIDSKILLKETCKLIADKGYQIGNVDSMVLLEAPKIKPYLPMMRAALSECMEIPEEDISIKATTNERLGFIGREEGVSAYATVLISTS